MVLASKSLLRDPKLRSGAKALVLALSLWIFPLWVTGIMASLFYFFPSAFVVDFLGAFIVLGFLAFSFSDHGLLWLVTIGYPLLFFLLIGIKNVYLPKRAVFFSGICGAVFLGLSFGLFADFISLPVFAVAVFLLVREGLRAFTTLSQRANSGAAVMGLILSETAWVIAWLGVSAVSGMIIEFIFAAAMGNIIYRHLRGEIADRGTIFLSSALVVTGMAAMLLAAFK